MIQLQLETTATCNAKCEFCPYPISQRHGLMSIGLFEKIMVEAAGIDLVTEVCLTGLGEPTLDPRLVSLVKQSRAAKPKANIGIYTNGVYLTPQRFDQLKDAGLSYVVISLNAVDRSQHEARMGLIDKFSIVCANADYAIKHADKVAVEVRAVVSHPEWTREMSVAFYDRWGFNRGKLISEGNWADANRTTRGFKPNEACNRALYQIYVLQDGRVTPCCFKPMGDVVFGDLTRQTIREVYSSPEYVTFREAHFNDRADQYDFCARCTRI